MLRAGTWLAAVAAVAVLAILGFSNLTELTTRVRGSILPVEIAAQLVTGITAVVAAFHLSLPDRPARWALLPLPSLAVWIGSTGYSCWRHWIVFGPDGRALGEAAECFRFLVAVGIPLAIGLLIPLRRARPLSPVRVAIVGSLGVGALGAFLLEFFHPFDVTFIDFGGQLVAIGLVMAGITAVEGLAARRN